MSLITDLKQYITDNKNQIILLIFLMVLAYGYFITNWAISIDSELTAFLEFPDNCYTKYSCHVSGVYAWLDSTMNLGWLNQGRLIIPLLNLFSNFAIMPFWNDFVSIFFIFCATLVWATGLTKISNDKQGIRIFTYIFAISPIYVFYLRFTTFNVSISIAFLFISLAIYYFIKTILLQENNKSNLKFSIVYLFLALCTYQMFVVYWITSILVVINYVILTKRIRNNQAYIKDAIKWIGLGIWVLLCGLLFYKITSLIINHFFPDNGYTDDFIRWGKFSVIYIYMSLIGYLNDVIRYPFNFLFIISLISSLISLVYLFYKNYRNLLFIFTFISLLISPFILVFAFGSGMPLRTMEPIALMLAGVWLLVYNIFKNYNIKRAIVIIVFIFTAFNAQYIVKLLYGDNMRLHYDINFANQIYSFVTTKVGSQIKSKPLVIVGKHSYLPKPFILRSGYDTLGYSFFEWDAGNYSRMHYFMSWLGDDYIVPSADQQANGVVQASDMPNYPDQDSLKVTNSLIILKLSSGTVLPSQKPIDLDIGKLEKISSDNIRYNLDSLLINDNQLILSGWGYIKFQITGNTNIFVKFKSNDTQYIYPVTMFRRDDISRKFNDAVDPDYSGFNLNLDKTSIKPASYKVYLIFKNKNQYSEVDTQKNIDIK